MKWFNGNTKKNRNHDKFEIMVTPMTGNGYNASVSTCNSQECMHARARTHTHKYNEWLMKAFSSLVRNSYNTTQSNSKNLLHQDYSNRVSKL